MSYKFNPLVFGGFDFFEKAAAAGMTKAEVETLLLGYALLKGRKNSQTISGGTEAEGKLLLKAYEGVGPAGQLEFPVGELLPLGVINLGGSLNKFGELYVTSIKGVGSAEIKLIEGLESLVVGGKVSANLFSILRETKESAGALTFTKAVIQLTGAAAVAIKTVEYVGGNEGGEAYQLTIFNNTAVNQTLEHGAATTNGFFFSNEVNLVLKPKQLVTLTFALGRWRNTTVQPYTAGTNLELSAFAFKLAEAVKVAKTLTVTEDIKGEGNIIATSVGKGLQIKEGANAKMGVATLEAGEVVVETTAVTASSRIFLTINEGGLLNVGTPYEAERTAAKSFKIKSTNVLDKSKVAWLLVEPS